MARTNENLCVTGHGEVEGSGSAKQLPSVPARYVTLRAFIGNSQNIYIGRSSAVTVPGGTQDATSGYPLDAGESITLPVKDNMDELWIICDSANDDLYYIVEGLVSQDPF